MSVRLLTAERAAEEMADIDDAAFVVWENTNNPWLPRYRLLKRKLDGGMLGYLLLNQGTLRLCGAVIHPFTAKQNSLTEASEIFRCITFLSQCNAREIRAPFPPGRESEQPQYGATQVFLIIF